MSTTIPTVTKEDIWAIKDLQTIYAERYYSDSVTTAEGKLDQQVTDWIIEAQGYVRGAIIETYHQYIDTMTWKILIRMYCKWQSLDMMYSKAEQELVQNSYIALVDYINRLNINVTNQAKHDLVPNHGKNIRFLNPS